MGQGSSHAADEEEQAPLMTDDLRTAAGAAAAAAALGGGVGSAAAAAAASAGGSWLQGIKSRVGLEPPPPPPPPKTWIGRQLAQCPSLGYQQRMIGFVICMALGLLLSLTSLTSFSSALLGNPTPFAVKYTIGNLLSLASYCFLVGPERQCKGMFAPDRRAITVAYLGSLVGTLFCVFYLHSHLLTLLCLVIQCIAMVYYALSYLPFGQTLLNRMIFGFR